MSTARAVVVSRPGDRSVLEVREVEVSGPGPGEVQVELAAAGVNFIDVYQRQGIYPCPTPFVLGQEGVGRVVAVGDGVTRAAVGDTVAWCQPGGSQSSLVNRSENQIVRVPEDLDPRLAAAAMMQGLTAHYLITSTHEVRAGEVVLVHAAAGGVGQLLVQLIVARGAKVIATAGSPAKLALARALGAEHTIDYSTAGDLAAEVRAAAGRGVDVVYDGVGRATFDASLASLRPRGMLVLFGASSGQVPPFDLQRLNSGGSLYVTRPTIGHHVADAAELDERATDLFRWLREGTLRVRIAGEYPFDRAADAYEVLEGRGSTGKLLLLP